MEAQKNLTVMGGSMRLGAYNCKLTEDSIAFQAYKNTLIKERHRHRYEFNNEYKAQFEAKGMKCTGINPETGLTEVVEIPGLTWYLGTQYHPEYNSTVLNPNPLFMSFIEAATKNNITVTKNG
jgi:CTP synthase